MIFKGLFWSINTVWFFVFITKWKYYLVFLFLHCLLYEQDILHLKLFCKFSVSISNFAGFLFKGFKYLNKHYLKYLLSSKRLINLFIEFLSSLDNGEKELLSKGTISEITNWCCNIEWIDQPDHSYVYFSTLDESWLCWISRGLSIFFIIKLYFFWIKQLVSKYYFLKNFIIFSKLDSQILLKFKFFKFFSYLK